MNELKTLQDIKKRLRNGCFSMTALEYLDTLFDLAFVMGERNHLQEQLKGGEPNKKL
jgi:hypothetical protein